LHFAFCIFNCLYAYASFAPLRETKPKMPKTLAVIGGGAAGFFCAVNAARLHIDLQVILFEKTSKLLSKVRISGGGRCNVTHACFDVAEMSNRYPRGKHFVKKIFHQFFTTDTIEWFQSRGVALKTEADGRMFPVSDNSQSIIDCVLREANKYHVDIRMNREIKKLSAADQRWQLLFANGEQLMADYVCIACGGYSKPQHFHWLTDLGHTFENPVPSLFTFNIPANSITALTGISVPLARIKIPGTKLEETGPLLITHWGLSGPAVLKLSAWGARWMHEKQYNYSITVNWVPELHQHEMQEALQSLRVVRAARKVAAQNPFKLPNRLWEYFLQQAAVLPDTLWSNLTAVQQNKLASTLCNQEFTVKGKTTYKEEFVTAGGIQLKEIDANTMQSKICKGIFFAGEILDVDGITGGYNFQHAWTTGWIAARNIATTK
jgi:predicted Rossmann fold flavoprotein